MSLDQIPLVGGRFMGILMLPKLSIPVKNGVSSGGETQDEAQEKAPLIHHFSMTGLSSHVLMGLLEGPLLVPFSLSRGRHHILFDRGGMLMVTMDIMRRRRWRGFSPMG